MSEAAWIKLGYNVGLDRMTRLVKIQEYDDKPMCYEELRAILYTHIQTLCGSGKYKRMSRSYSPCFDQLAFTGLVYSTCGHGKTSKHMQYTCEKFLIKILKHANRIAKTRDKKHPIVSVRDINTAHNMFREENF